MVKEIYHGSEKIVKQPVFGLGNPRNDYGLGFYCTEDLALAKEWAGSETTDGFANHYSIDLNGMRILDLNSPGYNVLNWMAMLLENRIFDLRTPAAIQGRRYLLEHFLPDYKSFDVIIGYRADDSYFSFAKAFLDNGISLEQLSRALHLGGLGTQTVIKSRRAFDALVFKEAEAIDSSVFYPRKMARDRQARESYFKMLEEMPVDAIYIVNIINEKWDNDEPRLR